MSDSEPAPSLPCVTPNLTNSLRLTISFSNSKVQKHPDATATESTDLASPAKVTSDNLFQVLSEVHRLLVRRDPKEIFANPVTDDVAFGYSQVIANPMDLGTIYTRLCSRTFYQSATDYLADVTLMCDNAMVYNSPDTIYYQRARKMLVFCRKQLSAPALRKIAQQLGLKTGLTEAELGESSLSGELPYQRGQFSSVCVRRLSGQESSQRISSRQITSMRSPYKDWYLVSTSDQLSSTPKITMARSSLSTDCTRLDNQSDRHSPSPVSSPANSKTSLPSTQSDSFHADVNLACSSPPVDDICAPTSKYSPNSPTDHSIGPLSPRRPRGRPRKKRRGSLKSPKMVDRMISSPTPASNLLVQSSLLDHSSKICLSVNGPPATSTEGHNGVATDTAFDDTHLKCETPFISTSRLSSGLSPVSGTSYEILPTVVEPIPSFPSSKSLSTLPNPSVTPRTTRKQSLSRRGRDRNQLVSSLRKLRRRSVDITSSLKHNAEISGRPKRSRVCSPVKSAPRIATKSPRRKSRYLKKADIQSPDGSDASGSISVSAADCTNLSEPSLPSTEEVVMLAEPEDEVLVQARRAAAIAADRLRMKYASNEKEITATTLGPRIVYLDCSTLGEVVAVDCWKAHSSSGHRISPAPTVPVNYPPIFVQCLTGSRPNAIDNHSGEATNPSEDTQWKTANKTLVDPPTPQEVEVMKQLEKLKYNPDEPISAAIHGPLAIFSQAEMARFSDVYGADLTTIEYAHSLLKFVEPMGRWARRWAAKRLDLATDGMHSQLARFAQDASASNPPSSSDAETDPAYPPATTWMQSLGLTLDSPTPPSSPEPIAFNSIPDEESHTPLLKCLFSEEDNMETSPSVDSSGLIFHLSTQDPVSELPHLSAPTPEKCDPSELASFTFPNVTDASLPSGPDLSQALSTQYSNNAGSTKLDSNDSDDDCVLISPIPVALTAGEHTYRSASTPASDAFLSIGKITAQSTPESCPCTPDPLNISTSSMLKCALSAPVHTLPQPSGIIPSAVPPKSIILDSSSKTRQLNGSLLQHSSHISTALSDSTHCLAERVSCETGTLLSQVLASALIPLNTATQLTRDGISELTSTAYHTAVPDESSVCYAPKLESDSFSDSNGSSHPQIVDGILENKHYSTTVITSSSDGAQESPAAQTYALKLESPTVHTGNTNTGHEIHTTTSNYDNYSIDKSVPISCRTISERVSPGETLPTTQDPLGDHSTAFCVELPQVDPFPNTRMIKVDSPHTMGSPAEDGIKPEAQIDYELKSCAQTQCGTHPAEETMSNRTDVDVPTDQMTTDCLPGILTSKTSSSCSSASNDIQRDLGSPLALDSELLCHSTSNICKSEEPSQITSSIPEGASIAFGPRNDLDMSGAPSVNREPVDSRSSAVSVAHLSSNLTVTGESPQFETAAPMNETLSTDFAGTPGFTNLCQTDRISPNRANNADSILSNLEVPLKTSDEIEPLLFEADTITAVGYDERHIVEELSSNVTVLNDHDNINRSRTTKINSSD